MVAIPHDFTPTVPDVLPPCCLEAEESVLGGILLEPGAIDQIKFRLKPEHFYLPTHRTIYEACLKAVEKNLPTDLLTVTDYLNNHNQLDKIGGKTKLVNLLTRCVSAVNIDHLAGLICQKALRRSLIELGNSTIHLGYSNELEIDEVLGIVRKKTERLTGLELIQTEDENRFSRFNKLIDKLKNIYTKIVEPDYRLFCLQELASEVSKSTRFLEDLYARHLVKKVVSPLMSYEELKQVARSSTKEWLHQGLFPKRTTGVLYGTGGILKTKLLYQICKSLIQGKNLGEFTATGEKRRIMVYQGDERESDMASALEIMGYDEGDIGQYIKTRFNWSFEHMPLLIQDLQEFKPDFVIIDSLTFSSRFSSYNENEVAYARPILELTGLANEHNTSFMLVHHANRNGDIRGSSAIFNAVSEVWKIEKDVSQFATPNDRLLTVEKSRSRSSGKKYRVIFEPDNLDFVFLGEQDKDNLENQTDVNCRASILEYLRKSPNVPYTCEELVHYVKYSRSFIAKALSLLVCDGLVNCKRGSGNRASTFYLSFDGAIQFAAPAAPHEGVRGQTLEQQGGAAAEPLPSMESSLAAPAAPPRKITFFEISNRTRKKRSSRSSKPRKLTQYGLRCCSSPKSKRGAAGAAGAAKK
ncbi:MAG: AAA family ATPase [Calothrix sp. CSU_2_0]|nr:AAA family ATPase [Calothrix sp. CSU_2_0]